jgi:hypothetical protein
VDFDVDDNANLALFYTPDIDDPLAARPMAAGLLEDCDPDRGGGVFFSQAPATQDWTRTAAPLTADIPLKR